MSLRTAARLALRARPALRAVRVAPTLAARQVSLPLQQRSFVSSALRAKEQKDAWAKNPEIGYAEVEKLSKQPSDQVLLIDIREPDEVMNGSIPGSVNLPLSRLEEALGQNFNPGDFQKEFAFSKPKYAQDMVFFCNAGERSATACEMANDLGFPNTRNYVGSLDEWNAQQAKKKQH